MASEKRKYHCVVICKLLCLVVVVLFIGTIKYYSSICKE